MPKDKLRPAKWHNWERVHPKPKSIQRFFVSSGRLGGQVAARSMTAAERSARAKRAVEAREAKQKLAGQRKAVESPA